MAFPLYSFQAIKKNIFYDARALLRQASFGKNSLAVSDTNESDTWLKQTFSNGENNVWEQL